MKQLLAVILFSLLITPAYGAFGVSTVWWVSGVSGLVTNGGAFDSGVGSPGTDESHTATAITVTLTGTTTGTCSPACSATTHGPGNFIHIASGAGCTTGTWYEILSQAAGIITVDKAMGSSTNVCVGTIGGQSNAPSTVRSLAVGGNHVCIKADGAYSVTTTFDPVGGSSGVPTVIEGYTSTCGVNGSTGDKGQATFTATAGVIQGVLLANRGDNIIFNNFIVDCGIGAGLAVNTGLFFNQSGATADNILIKGCLIGAQSNSGAFGNSLTNSRITAGSAGCTAGVVGDWVAVAVQSDTNPCPGFVSNAGVAQLLVCFVCISANNSGASSDGFQFTFTSAANGACINCDIYGNGRDGIRFTTALAAQATVIQNTWLWGNSGSAMNAAAGVSKAGQGLRNYNAYVSGGLNNVTAGPNDVTLTADPSTNGASLNFALNSTAGGGTLLKGTGYPGTLASSSGNVSIGAIQPLFNTPSGGGGSFGFVQ